MFHLYAYHSPSLCYYSPYSGNKVVEKNYVYRVSLLKSFTITLFAVDIIGLNDPNSLDFNDEERRARRRGSQL